jgi:hypothetical protein
MATPQLTIGLGEVQVGSVDCVLDDARVRAWDIDMVSKYAEVLGYSGDNAVMLHANERTLYVDEARRGRVTTIGVDVPDGWRVMAECARYTCQIVAYCPDGPSRTSAGRPDTGPT